MTRDDEKGATINRTVKAGEEAPPAWVEAHLDGQTIRHDGPGFLTALISGGTLESREAGERRVDVNVLVCATPVQVAHVVLSIIDALDEAGHGDILTGLLERRAFREILAMTQEISGMPLGEHQA